MSKIQLKKELNNLTKEQLVGLLLDIYSSNKSSKEYLDFFVNPDVDKLHDKVFAAIVKEMYRNRRGDTKARFSIIRSAIRQYESYGVGHEYVLRLMIETIGEALRASYQFYATKTFISGLTKLVCDTLKFGDKNNLFDTAHSQLNEALSTKYGRRSFINNLRNAVGLEAIKW